MKRSFAVTSDRSGLQDHGVVSAKSQRRRTHAEVEATATSAACLCLTETEIKHTVGDKQCYRAVTKTNFRSVRV